MEISDEMRAIYPRTDEEALLHGYFSRLEPPKPLAFTNAILNIVFGKPGSLRREPRHAALQPSSQERQRLVSAEERAAATEIVPVLGAAAPPDLASEQGEQPASPRHQRKRRVTSTGCSCRPKPSISGSFASKDVSGQGAIVDLDDARFGVSTVALARGLREHPDVRHRSRARPRLRHLHLGGLDG